MNKVFVFILLSSFMLVNLQAQKNISNNLVPNPSFENYTQCPNNMSQISFAYPWTDCWHGLGSSDYFNTCSTLPLSSMYNLQHSRSGNGHAGIYFMSYHYVNNNNREYLEVELNDSLQYNKKYCTEFYVSLYNYATYAVENIHAYFSIEEVIQNSMQVLPYHPQIKNKKGIINDTTNWVKISGSFNSNGGEKYITIGNFDSTSKTNYIFVNYGLIHSYYFIDDVSVCECSFEFSLGKDTTLCEGETFILNPNMPNAIYTWQDSSHAATYNVTKPGTYWVRAYFPDYGITTSSSINVTFDGECLKIPNVFTPNNDGKNDYFVIENSEGWNLDIQIFNRWGTVVYQNNTYKNNWDGKDVSDGVYYYIIKATNINNGYEKSYKGSVTVLR